MLNTQSIERAQLSLFHGAASKPQAIPLPGEPAGSAWAGPVECFSELALCGSKENCLLLLAPVLRELSQQAGDRWLTLIDAPAWLTRSWLRDAGLKRDVILLLKTRSAATAVELACEALQRGRSHTVISWLQALDAHSRQMLTLMALQGQSQSLNIRLG